MQFKEPDHIFNLVVKVEVDFENYQFGVQFR